MVSDFFISFLPAFRDANVLTKTTAISALAFLVIAPADLIGARYRRGVTRLQEENAELKRECRERRRAEEQLRRDIAGVRPQTIPGLAERVAFEQRDGNEERAIALVRSFVDHDATALGPLCREIASRISRWSRVIHHPSIGPPPSGSRRWPCISHPTTAWPRRFSPRSTPARARRRYAQATSSPRGATGRRLGTGRRCWRTTRRW